jgi:hypothetical protein
MKKIELFAALTKLDEAKREVWGLATAEVIDKDGEIFDYASSKPLFEDWSREIATATAGKSLGNVREMHQASAVGKLVEIVFDDATKTIGVGAKIVDDAAWQKCEEGVYTGFSIGGRYVNVWPDGECIRFTAQPCEISVVDNPAVPNAHFTALKADGTVELRKFAAQSGKDENEMKPEQEQKLDKAVAQSSDSLERVENLNKNLDSLESGLKELADAFRSFTEGFAKSFASAESKRIARTSVTVSKEDDSRSAASEVRRTREGVQGDADAGFIDAMKAAHARPSIGGTR